MKRYLSWSGGKDSSASIVLCHEKGIPLDGVVFSEVMFSHERHISGENPEHIRWVYETAIPTIEKMGYPVNILKSYILDTADKNLYNTWIEVLSLAKNTEEYNPGWNYGLSQICADINIRVGSGTFNKTGKEIEIPKYRILDEKVNELKRLLRKYYQSEIKENLFKYQLLK